MGSMGTHPLSSPMSSYYSAGMGAAMPGLSPNFGMPVSMSSMYSAGSSSMGMTAMSMSGVGTVGGMTSQGLASATSYPSSSSPYPGEWNILHSIKHVLNFIAHFRKFLSVVHRYAALSVELRENIL